MKIAFPSQKNNHLDSPVYSHFGTANYFIIVDEETDGLEAIPNADLDHAHGNCQPLAALGGKIVDAVVVGGIGRGALKKLQTAGITVYRAVAGTVADNLVLIKNGTLPEFTPDQTCAGHTTIGGCVH
jgi:predicted Fe-Mo cluster-binding NifX family protein